MITINTNIAMIKVHVANTVKRGEIKHVADMFQSRVVDVNKDSLIIEVTGEEEKVDSVINVLEEYGIQEVVRTGRVAMVSGPVNSAQEQVTHAYANNGHSIN